MLFADDRAQIRFRAFHDRRGPAHRDGFLDRRDPQRDILIDGSTDVQRQLLPMENGETLKLGAERVVARLQAGEAIQPFLVGDHGPRLIRPQMRHGRLDMQRRAFEAMCQNGTGGTK